MKKILDNLSASFKFEKGGYSARKLTSAVVMLMVVIAHIVWFVKNDFTMLPQILILDYGFVAALLGMTTYSQNQLAKKNESTPSE